MSSVGAALMVINGNYHLDSPPRSQPFFLCTIYAKENKYGKSVHKFWMAYLPGEPVDTIHRGGGRDTRGQLTGWCPVDVAVGHTISNSNQVSICAEPPICSTFCIASYYPVALSPSACLYVSKHAQSKEVTGDNFILPGHLPSRKVIGASRALDHTVLVTSVAVLLGVRELHLSPSLGIDLHTEQNV